ncbi:nitrite/sulfite reductase [Motilibacter aurantiacus]|uniref:nitrite/sulfite reductase n=1 Tax=Motilibacter aurantiacus TaxID=2714955 RepID=UPI001409889D|nr:nitrite/sulfite reductase [Motilibacter aurantiacus]NHC46094.1 nitrite/sulfite reductase [Motilibacter aurantiacus]
MPPAPRRKKGEGQWALGYFTPLNPNEQFKKDDDGLNVRQRVLGVYSQRGFDAIDPQDLRGRLRWWGLYTQRRPGIPGGQTAVLEPHELDDEYFMLRVRVDGGQLSLAQLRAIADVSTAYGRDTADVTDRQNIQMHWIRIEDVPAIWERLEAVGLTTEEACGDTPRVILGSPVAGVASDEILDGTPAVDAIKSRYVGDKAFSNLPRKFKTAISGSPRQDVAHEVNDISFVGVVHPEHGPGFDVWVGGGLSTNPRIAERLGAWVPIEEVPEVWAGVVSIFRDYGYRRLRNRARLKFLMADWGAEKFRQVLEDEYLGRKLVDGPAPAPPPPHQRDHIGVHQQRDGNYYVGAAPRTGRVSGPILSRIADLAESVGSDRVRLTPQQHLLVLDVPLEQVEPTVAALEALDLQARPSVFRRGTMACTGLEYCKLAIVETKGRASLLMDELERRLPTFDQPLSVHLNGCPNSCARIQTADIGLKGMVVQGPDGEHEDGFQVHLGGGLGVHAGFGRKLRGLKVSAAELPDYIERVARRFDEQREDDEAFAAWVARAEEADLR